MQTVSGRAQTRGSDSKSVTDSLHGYTLQPNTEKKGTRTDVIQTQKMGCSLFMTKSNLRTREIKISSTGYLSRGREFDSQHPHEGSQLVATPVPGKLVPSSGLHWQQALAWYQKHMQANHPVLAKSLWLQ